MIIKRIHIDRFGGLNDFSLSLSDGFNLVFGNNEDGKTTVMSFLRLMFYGEVTKKTDLTLNLRRRFTPFSGDRMGGEVEFTHGNKSYLLSKQFGKTPRSDRVSLIDLSSGESVPLVAGKEIGEMFFSLGAEAFERSIFIGSLPTDSDGSAELSDRLRRLAFSGEEGSSFEQVSDRLQKAKNSLRTPRRVGLSDKLEEEISTLYKKAVEAKEAEARRNQNCEQIEALEQNLSEENAKRDALKLKQKQLAERKALDALRAEQELRARYINNKNAVANITREQLASCKDAFIKLGSLKAQLLSERNKADTFAEGVSDSEILSLLNSLDSLNSQIRALSAESDSGKKSNSPVLLYSLAALLAVLAAVLFVLKISFAPIALIPAAVCVIAALTVSKSGRDKMTKKVLENKSRILELEEEKRQTNERYIILNERKKIADSTNQKAEESKEKCATLQGEISLLERYIESELSLADGENIESRLEELSLAFVRLSECESSVNSSPFKALSDDDLEKRLEDAEQDGDSLTAEECERALSVSDRQIHTVLKEIERIRAENDVIMKTFASVAVTEKEIEEKNALLARQEKHLSALCIAAEALESANADMRKGFAPELNRLTGEILAGLTGGRHSRVSVSDALGITVSEDGALPFAAEQLSAGSFDQAELSLRLAIAKLSGGENRLPLLLDDVLMQYDDERTKKALQFLLDYAKQNQVLLFTCHGYQKDLVDSTSVIFMKN